MNLLVQGGIKMQTLNEERKQFLNEERKQFLREHFLKKNLSKSEVEVVILVLQGLINREVANRLCVAEKTIKFHLGNAYKKLNISRRSELIWTLPLADFVGAVNKTQTHQDFNSVEDKKFDDGNEIIPSGVSTVSDME